MPDKNNRVLAAYQKVKTNEMEDALAKLASSILVYCNELGKQGARLKEAFCLAAEHQKALLEAGMKEAAK